MKPGRTLLRGAQVTDFHAAEVGRRAARRAAAGLPVVPMHYGQPSCGAPAAAIAAAHRVLDSDPLGYFESEPLIRKIASHYRDAYGLAVDPARILLTAGASAGLVAAYACLFRHGDRVAMATPGYPAYRNALTALGLQPVELRTEPANGYQLEAADLEALQPAPEGLLLASPANPTGAMLDLDHFRALAGVCRSRGIQLISDEIYHGMTFGKRAVSALEVDPEAIVVNSFSKLYRMPGWRLGWMVVPERWARAINACLINFFLTPSTLAQHAALAVMDEPEDLRHWVEVYRGNRTRLLEGLHALGISRVHPPEGAFYLYAEVGHLTQDSLQFCLRAVEEAGVALAPGIDFDPVGGHRYIRFSFAVSPAQVEQALVSLAAWLPGYRDVPACASEAR